MRALIAALSLALVMGCAGYQRDSGQRTVGEWTDDAAILSVVKARLLADETVKSLHLSAQVNRGVVTLFGSVATAAERDHVIALAQAVRGVSDVVDRIVVVP